MATRTDSFIEDNNFHMVLLKILKIFSNHFRTDMYIFHTADTKNTCEQKSFIYVLEI